MAVHVEGDYVIVYHAGAYVITRKLPTGKVVELHRGCKKRGDWYGTPIYFGFENAHESLMEALVFIKYQSLKLIQHYEAAIRSYRNRPGELRLQTEGYAIDKDSINFKTRTVSIYWRKVYTVNSTGKEVTERFPGEEWPFEEKYISETTEWNTITHRHEEVYFIKSKDKREIINNYLEHVTKNEDSSTIN